MYRSVGVFHSGRKCKGKLKTSYRILKRVSGVSIYLKCFKNVVVSELYCYAVHLSLQVKPQNNNNENRKVAQPYDYATASVIHKKN